MPLTNHGRTTQHKFHFDFICLDIRPANFKRLFISLQSLLRHRLLTRNPVVIALGSSLPETDIVLTDLRGQQAQFTQDDAKQILTLNLRR